MVGWPIRAAIGLFQQAFYKTIGGMLLSWTKLSEVVIVVETQLNCRPLSYVEEDVQVTLLTPTSFLDQRSIRLPKQEPQREENKDLRRRAKYPGNAGPKSIYLLSENITTAK